MDTGPRLDSYEWRGGREAMLRFGPADGPVVVLALPLLEEANRTRAFGVSILRALAVRGIGSLLPDLPGQGESLIATEQLRLADLRAAFAAAARTGGGRKFGLAVRSGALLDGDADLRGRWLLAPQSKDELLREWRRLATGDFAAERVEIAGNICSRELLDAFASSPDHAGGLVRTVRLASDPRAADLKIDGMPPWRRAEPDNDYALAQRLGDDIADWMATCGG